MAVTASACGLWMLLPVVITLRGGGGGGHERVGAPSASHQVCASAAARARRDLTLAIIPCCQHDVWEFSGLTQFVIWC